MLFNVSKYRYVSSSDDLLHLYPVSSAHKHAIKATSNEAMKMVRFWEVFIKLHIETTTQIRRIVRNCTQCEQARHEIQSLLQFKNQATDLLRLNLVSIFR